VFTPERSIFSILGQAFSVYGKSVKYLAVVTLMAFIPVFVFVQFIPQVYTEASRELPYLLSRYLMNYGYSADALSAMPSAMLGNAISFFLMAYGIELVFFPISVAAATYLVFKHLKEEQPTFSGMFTAALPILPKMMITSAIVVFISYLLLSFAIGALGGFFGGFLLMIAIYISIGMMFYQHIVADVGRWGFSAISLSRFIIRGRWFKVFFGFIVIIVCYGILAWLMEVLWLNVGIEIGSLVHLPFFLIQHFVLSYFAIVFAIWYFDVKRFHTLSFQDVERELMEKMREHMDKFGKDRDDDDNSNNQ